MVITVKSGSPDMVLIIKRKRRSSDPHVDRSNPMLSLL